MKQLFLSALLVAGVALTAPAQTSRFLWQQGIETPAGAEQARQMIKCRTGGYLICGSINDSLTTIPSTYVVKVDEQGQKVWERRIDPDQAHQYEGVSIAENRSGQILIATTARDPAGSFPFNYDARIDLLSATGQMIWHLNYNSPLADHFRKLKLGNDGNFVGLTSQLGSASLFKMDSTGRFIWQQSVVYDSIQNGNVEELVAVSGGYVAVSIVLKNVFPNGFYGRLVKLSESGIEQYRKPAPRRNFQLNQACTDAQGNLLLAHGYLSRANSQLDTLWSGYYASFGAAYGVSALADGNALLLGQKFTSGDYNLSLAKVAPSGQLLADTVLWRFPGSETPVDVVEDLQGNYVLCGNTTVGLTGGPAIILAKLRPWRQTVGLPDNPNAPTSLAGVTLYPNPARDVVYLHGAATLRGSLVLRDALGRAVRIFFLDASAADAPLSLAGLPAGLYLLHFRDAGGQATRTWRVLKQ